MLVQWELRIEESELLVEVAETTPDVGQGADPIDVDESDDFDLLDEDAKDEGVGGDDPALDAFFKGLGD